MRALRAELLKLGTLPAVPLTAVLTVVLTLALAAGADRGQPPGPWPALTALRCAQAGFLVLGVVASTSEYRHGTIRVTLVALPRRLSLQLAKATALAVTTFPVAIVAVVGSVALSGSTELTTAAAVAAHLTCCALVAGAVGATVRQATAATGLLLGLYFVAGPVLRAGTGLGPYLPDAAAGDPAAGVANSVAWVVVALVVAAWLFRQRDA